MTLPYERTRAIVKTEEFLRELSRHTGLPQDIRSYAKSLLRHYPSAAQVFSLGRLEECLVNEALECGFHADSDTHSTHIRTVIPR